MTTGFTLSLAHILLSGANAMSLGREGGGRGEERVSVGGGELPEEMKRASASTQ